MKIGRGRQYRYTVPADVAALMLGHALVFGEAISFGVDDLTAGRMVVSWVRRESTRLAIRPAVPLWS